MRGLKILQHLNPKTLRSLTHFLDHDVKSVRDNVTAMIAWGLEERNEDGMVHVPYNVIHAEFDLKAVA
jgi:predicted transcriptional regulator